MAEFRQDPHSELTRSYDKYAHAVTAITEEHRLIHDGMGFTMTYKAAAVADEASSDILLVVPAGCYPHLRKFVTNATGGPLDAFLYEGTTASADGTALVETNNNRNSATTANMVVTHTPTVDPVGTQIDYALLPTLTAIGSNVGGVKGPDIGEEWVLKPSTKYLLRVTNNSGGAVDVGWHLFWYELSYTV